MPDAKPILFFDTETTGMLVRGLPADDPAQPRVVQLAAVLADAGGDVIAQLSTLIRPDGWTVSEGARDVHGISTDRCAAYGVPIAAAVGLFDALCGVAGELVAHNLSFDERVLGAEYGRLGRPDFAGGLVGFCTMQAATPVCRLPGRQGFKWPTLAEAHRHLIGTDFVDAHDALADVLACMRCYFELKQRAAAKANGQATAPAPS
jgi:DNA polymerase III epsilon subunit-like protein